MTKDIINGIADSIKTAFPEIAVYKWSAPEDASKPHFLVLPAGSSYTQLLGRRYIIDYFFNIRYLPDSGAEGGMLAVEDGLYAALEWITAGGVELYGTGMAADVDAGTTNFTAGYRVTGYRNGEDIPLMSVLKHGEGVKKAWPEKK